MGEWWDGVMTKIGGSDDLGNKNVRNFSSGEDGNLKGERHTQLQKMLR